MGSAEGAALEKNWGKQGLHPHRALGSSQGTVPPSRHTLPRVTQVGGVDTPGPQILPEMQQPRLCLLCLSPDIIYFLPVHGLLGTVTTACGRVGFGTRQESLGQAGPGRTGRIQGRESWGCWAVGRAPGHMKKCKMWKSILEIGPAGIWGVMPLEHQQEQGLGPTGSQQSQMGGWVRHEDFSG